MFGKNPKRSPESGDGTLLYVQEIFSTFQGEGPNVGWPAVFLRLGGCNLACTFCDTEFESFQAFPLESILNKIQILAGNNGQGGRIRNLVVITGGEPFRQPIAPLCGALIEKGFKVQIETNGTLYRPLPKEVEIVCSPKNNNGTGYQPLRQDLLEHVTALKFIISAHSDEYREVVDIGQEKWNIPVYVQPMDEYHPEKNKENLQYTVKLALEQGYRVSLQTHKIAEVA